MNRQPWVLVELDGSFSGLPFPFPSALLSFCILLTEPETLKFFLDCNRTINSCNSTVTVIISFQFFFIVLGSERFHVERTFSRQGFSFEPDSRFIRIRDPGKLGDVNCEYRHYMNPSVWLKM